MDDLTAFVGARLDEDEAALRDDDDYSDRGENRFADMDERTHRYVWRFADNDRVRREIAAKRAIVNAHVSACTADRLPHPGATVYLDGYTSATEVALRELAAVWSDHPDYRQEWHPPVT